jgi:diguanylate cyclase (GGDEF)-like protein
MIRTELLSEFLVATSAICVALAAYAWRMRQSGGALPFAALMLSGAVYAFGFAREIQSATVQQAAAWLRFEYLGIPWLGITWYLTSVAQVGRRNRVPPWLLPIAISIALATTVIVWTNDRHHAFYATATHTRLYGVMVLRMRPGGLYWLHLAITNGFILAGLIELIRSFWGSPKPMRYQRLLVVIASLFPWLSHVLYRLGLTPLGLDLAPIGFALAGATFAWAILHGGLLDLVPVAHDAVIATLPDPVFVFNPRGRLVDYNHAAALDFIELSSKTIGSSPHEVFAEHPHLLALYQRRCGKDSDSSPTPPKRPSLLPAISTRHPVPDLEEVDVTTSRGRRRYRPRISPVRTQSGRVLGSSVLLIDVTEEFRLRERLTEQATHDALTGLANRRNLVDSARRELQRAERLNQHLSALLIDADHFKRINDTFGHPAGDAVLVELAQRIRHCLRASDHCCRMGGEEFFALLPAADETAACSVAERIRREIAIAPVDFGKDSIFVTVSAGVATFVPSANMTVDELIARADSALYLAKERGRNCVQPFRLNMAEPAVSVKHV